LNGGSLAIANSNRAQHIGRHVDIASGPFSPLPGATHGGVTLSDITFMTHALVLGGRCPFHKLVLGTSPTERSDFLFVQQQSLQNAAPCTPIFFFSSAFKIA